MHSVYKRILIAEDESLIALQLEDLLQGAGYTAVGPASSVREVENAIARNEFDGALLDVNLRGEPIFPLLPKITEMGKPFIITSGYHAQTLFPPAFRNVPRAAKPFDEARLIQLCAEIFQGAPG